MPPKQYPNPPGLVIAAKRYHAVIKPIKAI